MPVQLIPATFECPTHHVDLTPQVVATLEEAGPPIAFSDRPFEVEVSCPGDGTAAAHALVCEGRFRP